MRWNDAKTLIEDYGIGGVVAIVSACVFALLRFANTTLVKLGVPSIKRAPIGYVVRHAKAKDEIKGYLVLMIEKIILKSDMVNIHEYIICVGPLDVQYFRRELRNKKFKNVPIERWPINCTDLVSVHHPERRK